MRSIKEMDKRLDEREQEINKLKSIIRRTKEKVKGIKEINNEIYKQTDILERFYSRKWCNDEMDNLLEILDKDIPKKSDYNYEKVEENKE